MGMQNAGGFWTYDHLGRQKDFVTYQEQADAIGRATAKANRENNANDTPIHLSSSDYPTWKETILVILVCWVAFGFIFTVIGNMTVGEYISGTWHVICEITNLLWKIVKWLWHLIF